MLDKFKSHNLVVLTDKNNYNGLPHDHFNDDSRYDFYICKKCHNSFAIPNQKEFSIEITWVWNKCWKHITSELTCNEYIIRSLIE